MSQSEIIEGYLDKLEYERNEDLDIITLCTIVRNFMFYQDEYAYERSEQEIDDLEDIKEKV